MNCEDYEDWLWAILVTLAFVLILYSFVYIPYTEDLKEKIVTWKEFCKDNNLTLYTPQGSVNDNYCLRIEGNLITEKYKIIGRDKNYKYYLEKE